MIKWEALHVDNAFHCLLFLGCFCMCLHDSHLAFLGLYLGYLKDSEVREARKLKASHENVELLKEKLVEEKGRRERAEAELLKLREVQLSMEMLEDESSKKVIKDVPGVSSSDGNPVKFVALQKYVLNFSKKIFCYVFNDYSLWEFLLVLFVIRMKKALKVRGLCFKSVI